MNEPLQLYAYSEARISLTSEDAHFIATKVADKIRIRRAVEGADYYVNPQQYIGVVALPSGRRMTVSPRIPTSSILFMLAIAYQFRRPFRQELEKFERLDEILEPVAEFFAELVLERIQSGLYRAYLDTEENLRVLKGRIDFPRHVTYNSVLRNRIYCRYSELTWDIPENQVVRYVCHLLSGWRFRSHELRRVLVGLDNQLDEVSHSTFVAADALSFTYHRLNEPYRRIHSLCALFLEAASLSEVAGVTEFRTFLLDMNALFEAYVTQVLVDYVREDVLVTVAPQEPSYLGEGDKIRLIPDLIIRRERGIVTVADCKYKPTSSESEYTNHDYYQMLAYCTALKVSTGILIYPKHEATVESQILVRHSDVVIKRVAIDLRGTPTELRRESDRLCKKILAATTEITAVA